MKNRKELKARIADLSDAEKKRLLGVLCADLFKSMTRYDFEEIQEEIEELFDNVSKYA